MTLLATLSAVGIFIQGLAAMVTVWVLWHVRRMRTELNSVTHDAISGAHTLGVAEGVVHAAAAIGAHQITEESK